MGINWKIYNDNDNHTPEALNVAVVQRFEFGKVLDGTALNMI